MEKEKEIEFPAPKPSSPKNLQKPKRRNYKKELGEAIAEKNALKERLLRTAADFDNYRKRANNEKLELLERGNADLIAAILPVLDDLERFASVDDKHEDFATLHAGVVMILKNFKKILGDYGVVELETINKPFDPEKHDALLQMAAENTEPNIVIEQHLKGYEFKEQVLRHAKVIVSK